MTNRPRRFMDGNYYHIYGRGNHRDIVFRENPDRVRFLSKLEEFCGRDGQSVIAYCLMNNHYHLALRQDGDRPISETMRSLLQGYGLYFNSKYGTVGSLFQGRFQSRLVDNPQYNPWDLARLSRYIHRNPAKYADFTRYRWSSYQAYVRDDDRPVGSGGRSWTAGVVCDNEQILGLFAEKGSYATFCQEAPASERAGLNAGGVVAA